MLSGRRDTQAELGGEGDEDTGGMCTSERKKKTERQCMESKREWLACNGFLVNGGRMEPF